MRIALSTGWFFPESVGGTEVYVAELARELQAAGLWQAAEFAALRRMGALVVSGRDVGAPRGGESRQAASATGSAEGIGLVFPARFFYVIRQLFDIGMIPEFYSKNEYWEGYVPHTVPLLLPPIVETIEKHGVKSVLDLGCGKGGVFAGTGRPV